MPAPIRAGQAQTGAPVSIEAGGTNTEGTSQDFARADHVHQISDGSQEVTASGATSTTATTFSTISGMSITPPAGTYLVWLDTYGSHQNNSAALVVGLAVDGADIAVTERMAGGSSTSDGHQFPTTTQGKIVVDGTQAIQGRFRRDGGSGNVTVNNRSLMILKVA